MIDGFHKIENIFTKDQREKLIEDSQSLFVDGKQVELRYRGRNMYQEGFNWFNVTYPTLHLHSSFDWAHQIIESKIKEVIGRDCQVVKSWMNISRGNNIERTWHHHPACDYACVYYMKLFPFFSNGTLFKDYGFIKAKENSLLCFPSQLEHTTPSSPLRFKRHSWAMNLNIKKDLMDGTDEGRTT